jgi:hypothetical protein
MRNVSLSAVGYWFMMLCERIMYTDGIQKNNRPAGGYFSA